jgi:hypothetical protein
MPRMSPLTKRAWQVGLIALGLTLVSLLLVILSSNLNNRAEQDTKIGAVDASETILAISEAVNATGLAFAITAAIANSAALTFSIVGWRRRAEPLTIGAPTTAALPDQLDALISSLADLEASFVSKQAALRDITAERERNENLISLTRSQAQAMRSELESTTRKFSRPQTILAVAGILITVVLSLVSILLSL